MDRLLFKFAILTAVWTLHLLISDAQKVNACCESVRNVKFSGPITGYTCQEEALPCVKAVILIREGKKMCFSTKSTLAKRKIEEFEKNKNNPSSNSTARMKNICES